MSDHVHEWCEVTLLADVDRRFICTGCLDEKVVSRRTGRVTISSPTGGTVVTGD